MSLYAKEFFAVHFALDMFANILWGFEKLVLVLTDNRAVNRSFQTKIIPPTLWNALDHKLSFDIILGHIPRKLNFAADYLSRIHINPKEKLTLRINSKLPISEVQIDTAAEVPDNSINTLLHEKSKENTRKHCIFQTVNETDQTEIIEEVHTQQIKPAQLEAIHDHNPMVELDKTGHSPLNIRTEQQRPRHQKGYHSVRKRPTNNRPISLNSVEKVPETIPKTRYV